MWATLADAALCLVNRVTYERILKGLTIDTINPAFLNCGDRYRGEFLPAATLRPLAADPANQIDPGFLERALGRGDECYGFFAGPNLASYGWYSHQPTEIDADGLALHFDPSYIYMYKGYTHPEHRGHRLHAIGMTRALQSYISRGFRGIVSYVDWNNFDSLKSCYRMGYKDFGNLYVTRLFGRYFILTGAGCRRYHFRLERTATA
jgi:hypothetical protein